jgi:hypothetical protein
MEFAGCGRISRQLPSCIRAMNRVMVPLANWSQSTDGNLWPVHDSRDHRGIEEETELQIVTIVGHGVPPVRVGKSVSR